MAINGTDGGCFQEHATRSGNVPTQIVMLRHIILFADHQIIIDILRKMSKLHNLADFKFYVITVETLNDNVAIGKQRARLFDSRLELLMYIYSQDCHRSGLKSKDD